MVASPNIIALQESALQRTELRADRSALDVLRRALRKLQ